MKKIIFTLSLIALTFIACNEKYPELEDGLYAEFVTTKGTFVAQLFYDQTPLTVANFVDLAEGKNAMLEKQYQNKPFFNGLVFHRVIKDFMIQGGDPLGNGTGGPGYRFPDEFVESLTHEKGVLSMANSGPATNGSQFFVTVAPTPHLNQRHTVFGKIVLGMDIAEAISLVETDQRDKPLQEVKIKEVNIIRKGRVNLDSFESQMQEVENERKNKEAKLEQLKEENLANLNELLKNAETSQTGLKMNFISRGNGVKPNEGETVMINYEGYLANGALFDSNIAKVAEKFGMLNPQRLQQNGYSPMPAPYSLEAQLIAGFKEGLLQMNYGDKAILHIPSHLGYGETGAGGGIIPPNADLIFILEILENN